MGYKASRYETHSGATGQQHSSLTFRSHLLLVAIPLIATLLSVSIYYPGRDNESPAKPTSQQVTAKGQPSKSPLSTSPVMPQAQLLIKPLTPQKVPSDTPTATSTASTSATSCDQAAKNQAAAKEESAELTETTRHHAAMLQPHTVTLRTLLSDTGKSSSENRIHNLNMQAISRDYQTAMQAIHC